MHITNFDKFAKKEQYSSFLECDTNIRTSGKYIFCVDALSWIMFGYP